MLTLHHTPNGGTERTRTVMGLIDNQVPNPSATVPCENFWVGRRDLNPNEPQSQCGALPVELTHIIDGRQVNERDATFGDVVTLSIRPQLLAGHTGQSSQLFPVTIAEMLGFLQQLRGTL